MAPTPAKLDAELRSIRWAQWALAASVAIGGLKVLAWVLTDSVAILSDAAESAVNVLSGFVALRALCVARKPRDANHPYGHGKIEFLAVGFEGALISLAGLLLLGRGLWGLLHPEPVQDLDLGLGLTALTGGLNGALGWLLVRQGKHNRAMALQADGQHLLTDALSSLGLLLGLALLRWTGWVWLDGLLAVLLATFILTTGWRLARKAYGGLMDEQDTQLLEQVAQALRAYRKPGVVDVHNLRVQQFGRYRHIDCHVTLPYFRSFRAVHDEIDGIEQHLNNWFGQRVEIFIHADPCAPSSCPVCALPNCPARSAPQTNQAPWTVANLTRNQKHQLAILEQERKPPRSAEDEPS